MSGLRDELAALADEWERECNGPPDRHRTCKGARLRALLDRFPPEAEGAAERLDALLEPTYDLEFLVAKAIRPILFRDMENPVGDVTQAERQATLWDARQVIVRMRSHFAAALAASPEEQDR